MKKILVTGANGYVWARVYEDLKHFYDTIGTYHSRDNGEGLKQLDITDAKAVSELVEYHKPELIVHLSGNASVKTAQENGEAVYRIDVNGMRNVVVAANLQKAKLIYLSSMASYTDTRYGIFKSLAEGLAKETRAWWNIIRAGVVVWISPNNLNDRPYNRITQALIDQIPQIFSDSFLFQPSYIGQIFDIVNHSLWTDKWWYELEPATPELTTMYRLASDLAKYFSLETIQKEVTRGQSKFEPLKTNLGSMTRFGLKNYNYDQLLDILKKEIQEIKIYS